MCYTPTSAAYSPNVVLTDQKWQRFLSSKAVLNRNKQVGGYWSNKNSHNNHNSKRAGKVSLNILGHNSIPGIGSGGRSNLFVKSSSDDEYREAMKNNNKKKKEKSTDIIDKPPSSFLQLNDIEQEPEQDISAEATEAMAIDEQIPPKMDAMAKYGSAIAGVFTLAIIAGLAVNGDEQGVEEITETVFTSYVPNSLPEILSVALGEGFAGFLGAVFAYVASAMRSKEGAVPVVRENEVFADTEYFFVRSIAKPLIGSTGLPIEFVNLLSVIVASANSELIKFSQSLPRLLMNNSNSIIDPQTGETTAVDKDGAAIDEEEVRFDVVDLFSDVVKWLEYDVLTTDFGPDFSVFVPNVSFLSDDITEGLTFGSIASLSSALYADLLYRYTDYGDPRAKLASSTRSTKARIERYVSKSITGAAIFGVYEGASGPLSNWFTEVLSGGVDGCVGSDNFNMCMEVYMLLNEPGATPEAQFRSLFTAVYGLSERLGVFADVLDAFAEQNLVLGNVEYARGVLVTVYSMIHNKAPFLEDVFQFSII